MYATKIMAWNNKIKRCISNKSITKHNKTKIKHVFYPSTNVP
jgi:hypothetical protein